MEMFDVHRKDVHNFDDYMNLKKPGFGGPSSAMPLKDNKGKVVNKDRKLDGYQRMVKRDATFRNQVFNPTYKAMGGDLVHKQEVGKNPYKYADLYDNMGVAMVEIGESKKSLNESKMTKEAGDFISNKIPKLMDEGYDQKQAIAIAYQMAREEGYNVPENPNEGLCYTNFTAFLLESRS